MSALRRRHLVLPLVASVVAALALGGSCTRSPTLPEDPVAAQGARLYRTYCGLCHGDRGEGYAADAASALTHRDFLHAATDDFLRHAIEVGRPNTAMAAYAKRHGGPLEPDEIEAIVRFLRGHARGPALTDRSYRAEAHGLDVRPIYERECAGCHGERGQGATALSLNNGTFAESVDDAFLRYAIAKGRRGTPMPAFESRLTPEELDALVVYIRGFQRPPEVRAEADDVPDDLPLVVNPEGGAARFTLREGRFVSSAQVAAALGAGKRLVILDARPPSDWAMLHIPGAVPCPYYDLDGIAERLPRDDTFIIAYCACPHAASGRVVDTLRERGFEHTAVLDEGIMVWRELGHPVEGRAVTE